MNKENKFILIFILLFSLVLSLTTININRMTGDEGNHAAAGLFVNELGTAWLSNPTISFSELSDLAISHHMHYKSFGSFLAYSPFHFIFLGLIYLLFGVSRFITILPSIIEVMILLFFAYKLSKLCYKDRRVAFLGVFLIAFNPLIFYYSTSLLLEIASTMFLVITVYYFSLYSLKNKSRYLYLTAIGSALAILTKPPMVLILPVLFLTLLWHRGLSFSSLRKKHKQIAVSIILFFIFLSPWIIELAVLETQGLSGLGKWTEHAGGFEKSAVEGFPLMDGTKRSYIGLSSLQNFVFYISTILHTWYLIPFFILAIVFLVKKIRALNIVEKASIVMVLVFFITFSIYGGAQPRFMIYIIPFIIIPTSRVIIKLFKKIWHPVVIAIMILAVAQCSHFLIATGNEFPVGKFDEASLYVIEDTESETSIISSQYRGQAFSFALLDKERKIYLFYMPRKESELEQMIEGKYSEPEWARFNIEYPKVNYIIVHEEYTKIDSEYDLLEFASKHKAFELVKTIEGNLPNTRTFIYKKK